MLKTIIKSILIISILSFFQFQISFAGNLLWKVESEEGTAYLLGSVHIGDSSMYPLNEAIEKAYSESCCLGLEFDLSKVNLQSFMSSAIKTDTSKLKNTIPTDIYDSVVSIMKNMGITETYLDMIQPWVIGIIIAQSGIMESGLESEMGIDVYFMNKAKNDKKRTFELESPEFQVDVFRRISIDTEKYFRYMLKDMNDTDYMIGDIIKAWIKGDDKKLEEMLFSENDDFEEFNRIIIDERNLLMAEKLLKHLQKSETLFIVVGAGHLIGKKSIIKILEDMGNFTITKID